MSFDSGKKLGLIGSSIFVILPIIAVALVAGYFISIFSAIGDLSAGVPSSSLVGASAGFSLSMIGIGIGAIIGIILLVVAMYYLSHYYNERGIFTNIIYAVILIVVAVIALSVLELALILPVVQSISPTNPDPTVFMSGLLGGIIAIAIVSIVITIISALLIMRAFNKLGEKSEVSSFKTVGLLVLIGTLLSVVFIGVFILWIAAIFAAWGFYRLNPLPPPTPPPVYSTAPVPSIVQTVCPHCGAMNNPEAVYCKNCGAHL
jgi:uncharacterized membrane protein